MLADAGQVLHDVDAERAELVGVAHARQLQQLRRVDRAAAQDDLARRIARFGPTRGRARTRRRPRASPSNRIFVTNARVSTSRFGGS